MPFTVNFSIDEDKMDPASAQAGNLTITYNSPSGDGPKLGHWRYSERYEAGNEEDALPEVCAAFEAWKAKRVIEIEIEASLREQLEPLCPCHETEEPEE